MPLKLFKRKQDLYKRYLFKIIKLTSFLFPLTTILQVKFKFFQPIVCWVSDSTESFNDSFVGLGINNGISVRSNSSSLYKWQPFNFIFYMPNLDILKVLTPDRSLKDSKLLEVEVWEYLICNLRLKVSNEIKEIII